jgi:hypothetical protein
MPVRIHVLGRAAVGLRPAGVDAAVTGFELLESAGEVVASELVAVVGEHMLQLPAGSLQLAGDTLSELARLSGGGLLCLQITSSAQA